MAAKYLLWVDMEMTGLDEKKDKILEVAITITDLDLNCLEEYDQVVYQPPRVVENMNEWSKKHHAKSGLTLRVQEGKPLKEVENEVITMVNKYFKAKKRIVLAGNSVGNDKRFIEQYMHRLANRLHYRIIDVSSFKEIFREKYGIKFKKQSKHRAIADIRESIAELKTYLSYIKVISG